MKMYNPSSFVQNDLAKLHAFLAKYSFATLLSNSPEGPSASHLPLLLEHRQNSLFGHFAKANPHWQQLDGQSVLAIFHGPHAYISPSWYEVPNTVPTWNYSVVHVRGTCQIVEDQSQTLEILQQTVHAYESERARPWSMDRVDLDLLDKLMASIVAFKIPIESIEGKWKLNQNHDESRRQRVIDQLNLQADDNSREIARLMRETLEL